MAFFPFAMPPADTMETMQNCFRQLNQNIRPYMAMGEPRMAQAQAQAGQYWQQPHFPSQYDETSNDEGVFHVDLDVHHFSPEEISVKMVDGRVVIEGKHDDRESGRRSAARHFIHNYSVPEGVKFEDITSSLSSDGVLSVSSRKPKNGTAERVIPIIPTGLPAKKPKDSEPSTSKINDEQKE